MLHWNRFHRRSSSQDPDNSRKKKAGSSLRSEEARVPPPPHWSFMAKEPLELLVTGFPFQSRNSAMPLPTRR